MKLDESRQTQMKAKKLIETKQVKNLTKLKKANKAEQKQTNGNETELKKN